MSTILVEKHRFELQVHGGSENGSAQDERRRVCEKLGLAANACLPEIPYPEIAGRDLLIWDSFLLCSYSRNREQWGGYIFDCIPQSALDEIEAALDADVFTDIEIWTPEKRRTDPMAVGVLGSRDPNSRFVRGRFFKIVRWGEALLPLEEIERRFEKKMIVNNTGSPFPEILQNATHIFFQRNGVVYPIFVSRCWFLKHCGIKAHALKSDRECGYNLFACGSCGRIVKETQNGSGDC